MVDEGAGLIADNLLPSAARPLDGDTFDGSGVWDTEVDGVF
jgi:hypothetical protein